MKRRTRNSEKQPSTSRQAPSTSRQAQPKKNPKRIASSSEDSEGEAAQTQSFVKPKGPAEVDIEALSNNMVKYMLNYSDTKVPVKRATVSTALSIPKTSFVDVLDACKRKMVDIYGLEVSEIEYNKAKAYIVHPDQNYIVAPGQMPQNQRQEITLLFIILSYIFMKGGSAQESHLQQFLNNLSIRDSEDNSSFGNIDDLIRETFCRQLYLKRNKVEIEGAAEATVQYVWGPRAEKEFNRKTVLQAVAEIMKKSPMSFVKQFHEANQTQDETVELIDD